MLGWRAYRVSRHGWVGQSRSVWGLSLTEPKAPGTLSWVRRHAGLVHRWARPGLLALLALASLGLGGALLTRSGNTDQLVGVGSLFVGLASLAVSLAQLPSSLPPPPDAGELADYLAVTVREQWDEEVSARQLRDPRVIPLTWAITDRPVGGPPDSVVGPLGAARLLRLSMNGRLDGRFDEAATQLAHGYRQVPSGRLVVLGEPGAGKTVLALMLTLGLLRGRDPHGPVPVLLSVSTWDPVTESLDDWIVDTLASAYYGSRPDIPRRLLERRLLLPILDGLDEIPEVARRSAVRALNHAYGDGRGVVLTCRSAEYEDVIEGGSPVLRRAPVVEVAPVSVSDGVAYLQDVSWPAGIDWEPVYDHLRRDPASALAIALSTPLTLSIARTVYLHCNRDPRELLTFDSRHGVEDHLIDHVITAAYAPQLAGVEQPADGEEWRRRAERAERWLTFLATYLHKHRERDLAWWLMSRRLLSRWFGIPFGIALGLATMITVVAVLLVADSMDSEALLGSAIIAGAGSAILTMLTWYAAPDQAPGRLSFAVGGSLGRLRRGAATGLALISIPAVPLLATAAAVITLTAGWSVSGVVDFLRVVTVTATVAAAFALALAVHHWLDAPSERSTGASPLGFLRQDRTSSLVGALIAGAVLSVAGAPLLILGTSAEWMVLHALTGSLSQPVAVVSHFAGGDGRYFSTPALTAAWMLLAAVIFALQVLATRAWPRFALLRLVLAARGRLPWRLTRFLADARHRQLLRQSAGAYQFRHVRLQERLASRSLARDREPQPRARTVRPLQASVACAALLVTGLTLVHVLPSDTSRATLFTGDVDAMAFSADGKTLTAISGRTVRRWNTDNGKELTSYRAEVEVDGEGSELDARFLAVRTDGSLVIAASDDDLHMEVGQWDGSWKKLLGLPFGYRAVLGAEGNFVAVPDSPGIVVTNLHTGQIVHEWPGHGEIVALSADGTVLVTEEDGAVTVTDLRAAQDVSPPVPANVSIPADMVQDGTGLFAMNADGTQLATAQGYSAQIWESTGTKDGEPISGPTQDIENLALSPDGRLLAATADGTTRLWRLEAP